MISCLYTVLKVDIYIEDGIFYKNDIFHSIKMVSSGHYFITTFDYNFLILKH
jgi:hypothetical protein